MFRLAADLVLVLHFAFIAFVLAGGLLVWRWPRLAWLHLPAAAWAVLIEFAGWTCPLTPLEWRLRERAGEASAADSFVEHYLLPVVYPAGLTREVQWVLGAVVLAVTLGVYGALLLRRRALRP